MISIVEHDQIGLTIEEWSRLGITEINAYRAVDKYNRRLELLTKGKGYGKKKKKTKVH